MTYKELKLKIKKEQKDLAQSIRNGKTGRKPKNRCGDNLKDYNKLFWNMIDYRHIHIAYCEFFNNTPYGMIEQPREENKPDKTRVKNIKSGWESLIDE